MPENKGKFNIHIESIGAIFIIAFVSAFILANFFIGFSLPIYLVAMAIAFILSVFYPRAGIFALTFLTVIFERFFTLAPIYIGKVEYKFYPIDVIILGIFLGIIFTYLCSQKEERKKIEFIKNDLILVVFIILNVAYFFSSVFFVETNAYLSFSSLKNYGFYSLMYFAAFLSIQSKEDLKRLFRFFMTGAAILIGFVIFGALNGEGLWTEFTPLSTSGVRILAFTHGLYLSLAFVAYLTYLVFRKGEMKRTRLSWIIPLWAIGIVGTMMRHLWISIAWALLVIYLFIPKEKKTELKKLFWKFSLAFLCACIFAFYAVSMFPGSRLEALAENTFGSVVERGISIANARTDESFAWRELVWKAAYDDFKSNPVFGIGTGKMVYVETAEYQDYVEVRNIHNSYLAVLIQLGVLGFGFLIYFIYKNLKSLLGFIKKTGGDFYAVSILGALLLYLVAFLFQPYLETNLLAVFFWISLGLSRKISYFRISY